MTAQALMPMDQSMTKSSHMITPCKTFVLKTVPEEIATSARITDELFDNEFLSLGEELMLEMFACDAGRSCDLLRHCFAGIKI